MYPNGKSGVAIKEECGMLDSSVRVVTMEELSALGVSASSEPLYEFVDVREDDVATLLYTSGTKCIFEYVRVCACVYRWTL